MRVPLLLIVFILASLYIPSSPFDDVVRTHFCCFIFISSSDVPSLLCCTLDTCISISLISLDIPLALFLTCFMRDIVCLIVMMTAHSSLLYVASLVT
jgi:hypothetical protein